MKRKREAEEGRILKPKTPKKLPFGSKLEFESLPQTSQPRHEFNGGLLQWLPGNSFSFTFTLLGWLPIA